jgi:polysaccharide export outer membrane protein
MRLWRLAILCVAGPFLWLIAGCTGERPPLQDPVPTISGPYRLDTGDEVRIVVYDQANLTNVYKVNQSGAISMPLVGNVVARGATTAQMEARIAAKLAASFLRDPDVSAEVVTYRPFFVLGEVEAPGQYPYVPGINAETAIAVAGGFTPRANMEVVRISRTIDGTLYEGRIFVTEAIRPGDTVFVSERLF